MAAVNGTVAAVSHIVADCKKVVCSVQYQGQTDADTRPRLKRTKLIDSRPVNLVIP